MKIPFNFVGNLLLPFHSLHLSIETKMLSYSEPCNTFYYRFYLDLIISITCQKERCAEGNSRDSFEFQLLMYEHPCQVCEQNQTLQETNQLV